MSVKILGTGHFLPGKPVHNDALPAELETSDEWIYSHTGIHTRHWVEEGQSGTDLALEASRIALKESGLNAKDLDMILFSTVTPDYVGFPASAAVLQDKLKAPQAAAMDLNAACSGFIYAMETAYAFIHAGRAKRVLVIGAEVLSHISNWKDRSTCVLFGDGAGAFVLEADETADPWYSSLHARGKDHMALVRRTGGSKNPLKQGEIIGEDHFLEMDGRGVYLFAVEVLGKTIQKLLEDSGLTIEDIDHIVPHQANIRIIEAVASRNKIPMEKFRMSIDETGNTSSASIPITYDKWKRKGVIQKGERVIMVGFGAGLTYGGTLIRA